MTLKAKMYSLYKHPQILKDVLTGKNRVQIRDHVRKLEQLAVEKKNLAEIENFIDSKKKEWLLSGNSTDVNFNRKNLNCICNIEDWERQEIKDILSELNPTNRNEPLANSWERTISLCRTGFIHRKDWEWSMGILAMKRLGMLNENSNALGIGVGKEMILYFLANRLEEVIATDLYTGYADWNSYAPADFPINPQKYAPFNYQEQKLNVLKMDGTKIDFVSNSFDIAFSFSSIEHFGGEQHSGALKCLKEIERVLRKGGIAVIATEFILNGKEHHDFYNRKTIYSDLIDQLDTLKLIEPLDTSISPRSLDTVMDVRDAVKWDMNTVDEHYKKEHPYLVLRIGNILLTSVMLVFRKK